MLKCLFFNWLMIDYLIQVADNLGNSKKQIQNPNFNLFPSNFVGIWNLLKLRIYSQLELLIQFNKLIYRRKPTISAHSDKVSTGSKIICWEAKQVRTIRDTCPRLR